MATAFSSSTVTPRVVEPATWAAARSSRAKRTSSVTKARLHRFILAAPFIMTLRGSSTAFRDRRGFFRSRLCSPRMTTHVKENFADSGHADPVSRTLRKACRRRDPLFLAVMPLPPLASDLTRNGRVVALPNRRAVGQSDSRLRKDNTHIGDARFTDMVHRHGRGRHGQPGTAGADAARARGHDARGLRLVPWEYHRGTRDPLMLTRLEATTAEMARRSTIFSRQPTRRSKSFWNVLPPIMCPRLRSARAPVPRP